MPAVICLAVAESSLAALAGRHPLQEMQRLGEHG